MLRTRKAKKVTPLRRIDTKMSGSLTGEANSSTGFTRPEITSVHVEGNPLFLKSRSEARDPFRLKECRADLGSLNGGRDPAPAPQDSGFQKKAFSVFLCGLCGYRF